MNQSEMQLLLRVVLGTLVLTFPLENSANSDSANAPAKAVHVEHPQNPHSARAE